MAHIKNIAIVGATGTVGRHIVDELLKTGKHEVTAITRHDSKTIMTEGVKVARVDYNDESTLIAALQGQQALIITMSVFAPEDAQHKLIKAAAKAGVSYVVPNNWGFDPMHPAADIFLGPGRRQVRKYIEELGKSSWVDFVSGFWYEFSLAGGSERFGFDLENRSVVFYDDGKARIHTSTWEQTARAVAKVFSLKEKPDSDDDKNLTLSSFKNKAVYFASFLVSQEDMFESVLRVTGTKREDWQISYESSHERLQKALDPTRRGDKETIRRGMYTRQFFPEEPGYASGAFGRWQGLQNEALGLPDEDLDERTAIAIKLGKDFFAY
ncbi:hypothetical protein VTO42DRAFT_6595 [Malbranchea cinnamomea]